jgi:osmotically-inducible protein OsmY
MKSGSGKIGFVFLALALFGATAAMAQMRPGMGQPQRPGGLGQNGEQPAPGQPGAIGQESQSQPQAMVDDGTLQREVHEQLATRGELANVHTTVKNGVVHLEGSVPRKENRKEARKLAESVPGVRGVKEKLTVSPNAGTAATSTTGAEKVTTGVAPNGSSTTAAQNPGSGTASPTLPGSPNANANAGALGQTQPSIGNMHANPHASEQAERDIRSALQSNEALAGVNAQVGDNNVILSGSVPSDNAEEQALSITQAHAAGRTVFNRMTVASAAASAPGSGGIVGAATGEAAENSRSAQGTQTASVGAPTGAANAPANAAAQEDLGPQIQTALKNEPSLANDDVKASVTAENVILRGTVGSGREKETARRIAESFAQGRRVIDRTTIRK